MSGVARRQGLSGAARLGIVVGAMLGAASALFSVAIGLSAFGGLGRAFDWGDFWSYCANAAIVSVFSAVLPGVAIWATTKGAVWVWRGFRPPRP
jgi:hypothetical protein